MPRLTANPYEKRQIPGLVHLFLQPMAFHLSHLFQKASQIAHLEVEGSILMHELLVGLSSTRNQARIRIKTVTFSAF